MATEGGRDERTICLFDVDGTLTPARGVISPEMRGFLERLQSKVVVGIVGGSDLAKQKEQLGDAVVDAADFSFSENGLVALAKGEPMGQTTISDYLGEDKIKRLVNWVLHYIADLDIPVKRGTFIEFRTGMLNVSPIGRNCSRAERNAFEEYDKIHNIRPTMVAAMQREFADYGLTLSIGGQISFDVFPTGWDKTYCLRYLPEDQFTTVHFFGDKTYEGGNDFEIFSHPRTEGHTVANPEETLKICTELFDL